MTAIQRFGLGLLLCCAQIVVQPATADPGVVVSATPTSVENRESLSKRISRAFMNCLMQIDENSAQLSNNPKVRGSEEKSAKLFCEQRKAECREKPDAEDCQIFLQDYGDKAG